jgi:hypothetical protein
LCITAKLVAKHRILKSRCPLYPQKRTLPAGTWISAKCHKQTSFTQSDWQGLNKISAPALPKTGFSLPRIGTSWTRINFWCVRTRIGFRRWQSIGSGIHLGTGRLGAKVPRTGQLVLPRVMIWQGCAGRLPTATPLAATPSKGAVYGWRNIGPWWNWRWSAVRVRPNWRRRNCRAWVLGRHGWPRNDNDLRRLDERWRSHSVLGLPNWRRWVV